MKVVGLEHAVSSSGLSLIFFISRMASPQSLQMCNSQDRLPCSYNPHLLWHVCIMQPLSYLHYLHHVQVQVLTGFQRRQSCSCAATELMQFTNQLLLPLLQHAGWCQYMLSFPWPSFSRASSCAVTKPNVSFSFPFSLCDSVNTYSKFGFVPIVSLGFQCSCH